MPTSSLHTTKTEDQRTVDGITLMLGLMDKTKDIPQKEKEREMRPHNTQHFLERNHSHPWSGYARTKSSFVSREIPYYRILTMHFVNAIFKKIALIYN